MKPSLYIKNEIELQNLLWEWQKRLELSDWFIGIAFADKEDMSDPNWGGESEVQWVNKVGTIKILKREYIPSDLLIKQPQEEMLIHELLHFKFIAFDDKTREEAHYEIMQHQLIENLARALYSAKYNLDHSWWINEL